MNSIWTDLLFLHGHLVRKEDLAWRNEKRPENDGNEVMGKVSSSATRPPSPRQRSLRWPHLSAPR